MKVFNLHFQTSPKGNKPNSNSNCEVLPPPSHISLMTVIDIYIYAVLVCLFAFNKRQNG